MPLPSSGPISADDLNEELGNSPGTSIDFETAANALLPNPSRPHGMDEFYGASANVTTYYIFESCDNGSLVMNSSVVPYSSQRAIDGSGNYYFYTNSTTTNAGQHTIASLTLVSATSCPPVPPVYISRIVEKNDGTAVGRIPLSESYPQGSEVIIVGYGDSYTDCWTVGAESLLSANLIVDGDCPSAPLTPPPPPPPPTPPPSPPPTTGGYNCKNGECVEATTTIGTYATIAECEQECEQL